MKVKESFWHEAAKADKNDRPNRTDGAAARRAQAAGEQSAASRTRQNDSPLKDETKFADFLASSAKTQKSNGRDEDSSEQRRDDRKSDKKHQAREKDSTDLSAANDSKADKYDSSGGQTGGGQGGFGAGAGVGQMHLSEQFAARSILHVADLERLVSTVRSQIDLGGRREIILQLKRSVLEGLQVKITTDPKAKGVDIEFLAASGAVREQVAEHAQELAGILRGRGINLSSLTTSLGANGENQNSSRGDNDVSESNVAERGGDEISTENTFTAPTAADKIYRA